MKPILTEKNKFDRMEWILSHIQTNGYFDDIFKGTAAQSFRDFVKHMGHTESTYPYHDTGNVVLKFWKGPNFKNREGGNNLPKNTLPWDKKNKKTKKIEGNNEKILLGKTEEVGAEVDKNEGDMKKANDGNDEKISEGESIHSC